jgi:hypothetical protein
MDGEMYVAEKETPLNTQMAATQNREEGGCRGALGDRISRRADT